MNLGTDFWYRRRIIHWRSGPSQHPVVQITTALFRIVLTFSRTPLWRSLSMLRSCVFENPSCHGRMAEDASFLLHTAANLPFATDTRRSRELYRHVEPQNLFPKVSPQTASSNTETRASTLRDALEPYVQLASLRCNTQRAFIA